MVWQFNQKDRFGKPYFYPLRVNNIEVVSLSPSDHPWHLGLWFSWKFIDGVNYWEYLPDFKSPEKGFKSEGITEVTSSDFVKSKDFSADISLKLLYLPQLGGAVLSEDRKYHISCPQADGSYTIDEFHLFKALTDSVVLDRTPLTGESGGQSWGGYSGLSVRFSQNFTLPTFEYPSDSIHSRKGDWLFMSFRSLTGRNVGMKIETYRDFTTKSCSWYQINDPKIPFYYMSPAILYDRKLVIKLGEILKLKYKITVQEK